MRFLLETHSLDSWLSASSSHVKCLASNWPVAGCSGHVSTRHPPLRCGFLALAVSQGDFFFFFLIGLSALGESSLQSSPKGRWPPGQMLCPARQGAKGAAPSPAKDCLLSRGTVAREEVTAQATATQELPGFLPFLSSGLPEPLESGVIFPNPRGRSTSLHWMDEHRCPPLSVLWAPGDRALSGRTHLRTQSKDFSVYISQKTDSRDYAG